MAQTIGSFPVSTTGHSSTTGLTQVMEHMGSASKTRLAEQERRMRKVQKLLGQQRAAASSLTSVSTSSSTSGSNSMPTWRRHALGHWMQTIAQKIRSSSDQVAVGMNHGTLVDEVNQDVSDLVTTMCGKFLNISEDHLRSSQGLHQFISRHVDLFRNVPDWMKVLAFLGTKKCKAIVGCTSTTPEALPIVFRAEPMSLDVPDHTESTAQLSTFETQSIAVSPNQEDATTACDTTQCTVDDQAVQEASQEMMQPIHDVPVQEAKKGQRKTRGKKTPQVSLDHSLPVPTATKKRRCSTKSTDAPLEHDPSAVSSSKKCKKESKRKEKQMVARNAVLKEHHSRPKKGHESARCSTDNAVCIGTETIPCPHDEGSSASSASSSSHPVML